MQLEMLSADQVDKQTVYRPLQKFPRTGCPKDGVIRSLQITKFLATYKLQSLRHRSLDGMCR